MILNIHAVKQDITSFLGQRGIRFTRIKAKKINFSDLSRSENVFFSVQGLEGWTDEKRDAFNILRAKYKGICTIGGFVGVGEY